MKTKVGLGPDGADELRDIAARMGPNGGNYKRMRLQVDPPRAAPPRAGVAPNAPTSAPRRRWTTSELLAAGGLAAAALGALAAAAVAIANHRSPERAAPPFKSPTKPAATRPRGSP